MTPLDQSVCAGVLLSTIPAKCLIAITHARLLVHCQTFEVCVPVNCCLEVALYTWQMQGLIWCESACD